MFAFLKRYKNLFYIFLIAFLLFKSFFCFDSLFLTYNKIETNFQKIEINKTCYYFFDYDNQSHLLKTKNCHRESFSVAIGRISRHYYFN